MDFLWECIVVWFKAGVGGLTIGLSLALAAVVVLLVTGKLDDIW